MKRAGVGLLLVLCVGCSTNGNLLSAPEIQAEFGAARSKIPLPIGYGHRQIPTLDPDAQYERGLGVVWAETYAQCAWFDHWLESSKVNDVREMKQSEEALTSFRSGHLYTSADSSYRRGFDRIVESITNSSTDLVSRELDINCPELIKQ